MATGVSLVDLVATATEFTARSIALAVEGVRGVFHDVVGGRRVP